jgi:hypothetical protein
VTGRREKKRRDKKDGDRQKRGIKKGDRQKREEEKRQEG